MKMEGKIVKNSEILKKYLRILQTQIQDIGNTLHDFETELYKEKKKEKIIMKKCYHAQFVEMKMLNLPVP